MRQFSTNITNHQHTNNFHANMQLQSFYEHQNNQQNKEHTTQHKQKRLTGTVQKDEFKYRVRRLALSETVLNANNICNISQFIFRKKLIRGTLKRVKREYSVCETHTRRTTLHLPQLNNNNNNTVTSKHTQPDVWVDIRLCSILLFVLHYWLPIYQPFGRVFPHCIQLQARIRHSKALSDASRQMSTVYTFTVRLDSC